MYLIRLIVIFSATSLLPIAGCVAFHSKYAESQIQLSLCEDMLLREDSRAIPLPMP